MKAPKKKKEVADTALTEDNVINTFVSDDNTRKAVVKFDKATSQHEVVFYENNNVVATESYAFHTRMYHERAAQNYVEGIKNL